MLILATARISRALVFDLNNFGIVVYFGCTQKVVDASYKEGDIMFHASARKFHRHMKKYLSAIFAMALILISSPVVEWVTSIRATTGL